MGDCFITRRGGGGAFGLDSIQIETPPTKTTYYAGELFNSAGMIVKAAFTGGTEISVGNFTVTPSTLTAGTQSVTISYTFGEVTKTDTQAVTVLTLSSIAITTAPTKTAYTYGETFNPDGMIVTATWSNGSTTNVIGYTYTPTSVLNHSSTTVTVSFTSGGIMKTTTTSITIAKVLTSIAIATAPNKTAYHVGESFVSTGMVVRANYSDGTTANTSSFSCSPSGALAANNTTIAVSHTYNGVTKTTTQSVTVATLASIAVTTQPTKTVYKYGETFSASGMAVTATYSDGTTGTVIGYTHSPTTALTHNNTSITVSYTLGGITKTTTVSITINKILTSIAIQTAPTNINYIPNQMFNSAGMVVTATYSDGSTATVTSSCTVNPSTMAGNTTSVTISYTYSGTTKTAIQAVTIITPSTTLASNSWETIAMVSAAGQADTYWDVGDEKSETLNGTSYGIQIIGFNHDNLASTDPNYGSSTYNGGTNKAGITFLMKQLFATTKQMNGSDTNSGGWNGCAMRSTVMPLIKGYMPTSLQNVLRSVNKLASAGSTSSAIITSVDQVFLLSEIEVFETINRSFAGEGTRYAYYSAGNSRVKYLNGSASWWWLRSPRSGSSASFVVVNSDGSNGSNYANSAGGVAAGFCV